MIPAELKNLEVDCEFEFVRSPGPGGQNVNKTATKVRLHHKPSGIVITCSQTRSQSQNKILALYRLKRKLEALKRKRKTRIPTHKSVHQRSIELDEKKKHSSIKRYRSRVESEE